MLTPLVRRRRIPQRCTRKRAVEFIVCDLKSRRSPKQRAGFQRSLNGRSKVTDKEVHLQLSHPVPELVHRRVGVEIALEVFLVELRVVKGAELCRQSSEGSNKTEDPIYRVNAKTELRLPRKVEAILRFTLHRNQ